MKIRTSTIVRAALLFALTINSQSSAFAQGTAFTYQGRLNDGATPANGVYDLQFAIYDAGTNGNQIGNALTNSATGVTNGLFTVVMDFGNIFTGGSNWLNIAVRTNGGSGFTALSPRQQLTAAPYAMFANTASNFNGTVAASQLTGTVAIDRLPSTVAQVNSNLNFTGVNTFSNNVGIGAPPGGFPLYVRDKRASAFPSAVVEADSTIGTWLRLLNDSVGGHNWNVISSGSANGEGPGRLMFNDQSVGLTRMLISSNGNVGIGTTDPKALLHVQGDIMGNGKVLMGNGGTNYAASSTENLRIVRGSINGDGSIARGSGFTALHNGPIGTGSFTITFTPAFSGTPSVTVTAVNVIARAGGTINASSVTVSTVNFGGAAVDDSFSFIAVGPY